MRLDQASFLLKTFVAVLLYASLSNAFKVGLWRQLNVGRHFFSSQSSIRDRLPNEFSRMVDPDKINGKRDYIQTLEATKKECEDLAKRFDLPRIDQLAAKLHMRSEQRSRGNGVVVEGTVNATLARVCVRTGGVFDEKVHIPLVALVRPTAPISQVLSKQFDRRNNQPQGTSLELIKADENIGMLELQALLGQDISEEEEDSLIEDEAIYSVNGLLDAGELVAQLLWLSLDPYPKRPGSSPVHITISG